MSALTRIAYGDHQNVEVERGDTVIISAKPVPGNELRVHDSINRLARLGAEVLHEEIAPVHVSGHACSEEIRTLLSLVRPKALMPIHGEYRMLAAHAKLGRDAGIPAAGDRDRRERLRRRADARGASGIVDKIAAGVTFVDGLGVGDVQDVALRDRRRLSEDGVLIVVTTVALSDGGEIAPPELIARGLRRERGAARRAARRGRPDRRGARRGRDHRDQAAAGAHARRDREARLRTDAASADDPARGDRGMSG